MAELRKMIIGTEVSIVPAGKADDDRTSVSYHAIQCIDCEEVSAICSDEVDAYNWQNDHYDANDHVNYWHFKITRDRARIVHPAKGHW